ncbi:MAG TPA: DUF1553 domain-containing protein [Planctomycetaceae bacterium]|nr:DUF1553 domain-containing protein [Planctomycetaceae bacterium]
MRGVLAALWIAACLTGSWAVAWAAEPVPKRIDFNRDIRPILSDACFQCHGPDENKRQADLRLDMRDGALADLGGHAAVVPGDVARSVLLQRIASADPEAQMPPSKSGKQLTAAQKERLRQWIEEGAVWSGHWSLTAPTRPVIPRVDKMDGVAEPIDRFLLSRLEQAGLTPNPPTDRTTWLRRVTFDLTGLPPSLDELDAFLADDHPAAVERVVDRLLASPRYGERMAVRWLDAARYADTSGYQSDGERFMWRWRDWVIDAYNRNLPFDQFTIEQLAGDLLPDPTLEQKIATGFHRNHRGNSEGGIVPEEYAAEYVVDRVETTYTVWMGLTMGCARCHSHKFDPLSQREFYQSFAFFNNVPEFGRASKLGNSPPYIAAPTLHQQEKLARLDAELSHAEAAWKQLQPELEDQQRRWEANLDPTAAPPWQFTRDRIWVETFDAPMDGSSVAGRIGPGRKFTGEEFVDAGNVGAFGFTDKFTLAAWIKPDGDHGGTILSRMTDVEHGDGYALVLDGGRLQLNLVKRWLDDALRVETTATISPGEWHHVAVTYDGSRLATGVQFYLDGQPAPHRTNLDLLNQTFATKEPLRIGGGNGPSGRFHGVIDEVALFNTAITPDEAAILATPEALHEIAAIPREKRTPAQSQKLQAAFLELGATTALQSAQAKVRELTQRRTAFRESLPTVMVMEEMPTPRITHVLLRGEYDKLGERVMAGTPTALPAWPKDGPQNRLALARWLIDPQHPLTARVAVNRLWQMLFGTGLVKTVDDFGSQGEPPSNPELLDWLAVEFAAPKVPDGAWDVKRILRMMVTSAVYQRSSQMTPELFRLDPENRLLARGPRLRLSAEMVRDQALFSSGLLVEKLGGPSVKPYQPAGLWKELADTDYVQDHGEALYRRSVYTFWKRTIPPPTMLSFDAAGRETCVVRESRTNTPLQALILMNDVTYGEAARVLAERVRRETSPPLSTRLEHAFRLVLSRRPRAEELSVLTDSWHSQHVRFQQDPDAAKAMLSQGESRIATEFPLTELAADAAIIGLLFNLDEAITKE